MSETPGDLRYTKDHEWLRQMEDGTVLTYQFFLTRQEGGRFDGCWMTDAVMLVDAVELDTYEAFLRVTSPESTGADDGALRTFLERRRDYLLEYEPAPSETATE